MIRDTRGDKPRQICRCTKESNQRKAEKKAHLLLAEMYGADDTIQETTGQSSSEMYTVADMVQSYFSGTYMSNQRVHTPEKIKKHVSAMNARINNLCEFFNSTPIDNLNKKLINKYIEHRRNKVVDGTIQVELNALFAAINSELSNSRRYNVIQNSKGYWTLDTKNRRMESLTYQQFAAIHEKLEEFDQKNHTNFALFVELLYETGVRWGQMSELKFNMIDFRQEECTLTFTRENMKTKEQSIHLVVIDKELAADLFRLYEKNENAEQKREYVFCSRVNPNKIFSRTTFYNAFYDAQVSLGYTKKGPKGKDVCLFRPHDLKRTFIMESLDMGYDRSEIKAMTNNVSDTIFDGYVNTRRIKKLVSNRRATRKQIIDEQNKRLDELKEEVESGIWDEEKLDELIAAAEKKKAAIKRNEELKNIDIDVEI
jgi:integrase